MLKSNWIAVIGAPNAGKSTLINYIIGQKVNIVTHKAQTTRTTIKAIRNIDQTQLVFIDTPGIFKPLTKLEKLMFSSINQAILDAGTILVIVDVNKPITDYVKKILLNLEQHNTKVILVLNKIDRIKKTSLLEKLSSLNKEFKFEKTFLISALNGDGINDLIEFLVSSATQSGWLFPEDQIATAPVNFLVNEIVREKILLFTHDEIPYRVQLETESFVEEEKIIKVAIIIIVPTEGQKKIIIGKNGALLKKIGMQARLELEEIYQTKFFMKLFIKVRSWEKQVTEHNFKMF
jgi:GTP-binding protein Era